MKDRNTLIRSAAMAALLALPFWLPAHAQDGEPTQDQTTQKKIEAADAPDTAETDTALTQGGLEGAMGGADAVVVTVGEAESSAPT